MLSLPKPPSDLELFVRVFARAYDRRFKVVPKLNEKARRHFRGMIKAYGREATCCLPILARSYDARRDREGDARGMGRVKDRVVAHLLHDGQNDRFDWSTLLQKADTLDPERLPLIWSVAGEFGIESGLEKLGVPHPLEVEIPEPAATKRGPSAEVVDPEAERVWRTAIETLRPQVPLHVFGTWFPATRGVSCDAEELVVWCPNEVHVTWVRNSYGERLEELLAPRHLKLIPGAIGGGP